MKRLLLFVGASAALAALFVLGVAALSSPADERKDSSLRPAAERTDARFRDLLSSVSEAERMDARRMVVNQRDELIQELLAVVESPVREGEAFYDPAEPRNIAIGLLGRLRAPEAAWELTRHLVPKKGQDTPHVELPNPHPPAARALFEIGLPALPTLIYVIRQEGLSIRGYECLKIIHAMLGKGPAQLVLETAIEKETDAESRQNLQSALARLTKTRWGKGGLEWFASLADGKPRPHPMDE